MAHLDELALQPLSLTLPRGKAKVLFHDGRIVHATFLGLTGHAVTAEEDRAPFRQLLDRAKDKTKKKP